MKVFKNGFSLVELVVSLTVILLLTGIGVTTFSGLIKAKRVTTVKNELSSWITLSRNLAITGQLPNKNLGLKFVRVILNGTSFSVDGVDDQIPSTITNFFVKTLGNEVDIDDVSVTPVSFGFNKGSGRLLDVGGTMINGPVRIVVESRGVSEVITINDLGVISEK